MSADGEAAPVYGPPKRNNYADWKRQCISERPLPDTVQASKDRFQRALLGCHLPPVQGNVDGAVAAALTFREQRPPQPPFRCPDSKEPCKPTPAVQPAREVKRFSVCEKKALRDSYRKEVKTSHPPPQFLDQRPPHPPCPEHDDKLSLPPYVVPDRAISGIPVRTATDCVYQYIRSTTKDGPRPVPLETTLLQRGDVCGPSELACPQPEPLQSVAERRCAKAGKALSCEKPREATTTPETVPQCHTEKPKPRPCGLTGVAEPYIGGPPFVAEVNPDFLPQARPTPPCPDNRHPGVTQVPPFVWPVPRPGTRIRSCTDCLPKRHCPGDPAAVPPERCAHFSPLCELGYFAQLIDEPCVYPCCVSPEQSEQLARQMRWTTMAKTQMEELKYPPITKVEMPSTTYERRVDPVSYVVERYEPMTSPCQQVPDVWDRAQTRTMIDHVVGDSDYVQKVSETLPTDEVMRKNKMVMKPCLQPSRYCVVSRDINIDTPCKLGDKTFTPDFDQSKIVCPSCV